MPAKTPIYLKTPTDRRGRKLKLRDVLSGDMISPPLGDVRHSAHVGLQGLGDMFGDVAFLQGNMDMLPPPNGHRSSPQALHPHQGPFNLNSQPLWTATSLPLLMAQEDAPPKPPRLHLDTPPHPPSVHIWTRPLTRGHDGSPLPPPISTTLPHSESMAALDLDLGPSILDDVLRIMDSYRGPSPAPGP
uniref:CRIB domain-containing protein n=1 Tax=Periophthalmus magnuspinnatus TaxID=409849 RepID=A0A3B3Z6N5_9GOBI